MFQLPSSDELYDALLRRDAVYEGRAYVGVRSTGIFCRLTCPARKPKRENCVFFECVAECLEAGFRPCKRCVPMQQGQEADPVVAQLLEALEKEPQRLWSEKDMKRLGHDPSSVRRAFKRHFGVTFLEMARQSRLRQSFEVLEDGGKVIDAQLEAGFTTAGGFANAFAKLLGVLPSELQQDGLLKADWIETPLGAMIAVCDTQHLHLLEFCERKALPRELAQLNKFCRGQMGLGRTAITEQIAAELSAYFDGKLQRFETPLALHGSAFTKQVWRALQEVPCGETRSYGALAVQMGRRSAVRAVARANGANQIAIVIPCHRVIGADGALTGYGGGLWRKQKLLELERKSAMAR